MILDEVVLDLILFGVSLALVVGVELGRWLARPCVDPSPWISVKRAERARKGWKFRRAWLAWKRGRT